MYLACLHELQLITYLDTWSFYCGISGPSQGADLGFLYPASRLAGPGRARQNWSGL